jgi:hypothetical protein
MVGSPGTFVKQLRKNPIFLHTQKALLMKALCRS